MENIGRVAEHLEKNNYPFRILKPYFTKKGSSLFLDKNGDHWRIFDFFENTISYDKVETAEQAYEAAKAFGAFAKALNDMDVSQLKITIPNFHDGEKRMADFGFFLKNASSERLARTKGQVAEILRHQTIFKKNKKPQLAAPCCPPRHQNQ